MWILSFDEKDIIDAKSFHVRRTGSERPEWELIGSTAPSLSADGNVKSVVYDRFDSEEMAMSALKKAENTMKDEDRQLSALFGNP